MITKNNKGIAMPIVVVIIAIVFITCTTLLVLNDNLTRNVSSTVNSENALHIAEAGYNKYLYFLNANTAFYKDSAGNPTQGFTPIQFYTAADNSDWVNYPKTYAVSDYRNGSVLLGQFQIRIVPPSVDKPVLTVISTGWDSSAPDKKRTIEVKINKRTFTNYVELLGDMGSYFWGDGEKINGPFFTNGDLNTRGEPVFSDTVGYVGSLNYQSVNGKNKPLFTYNSAHPDNLQPKKYNIGLAFPSTNTDLEGWGTTSQGGITYKSRTCILLKGSKMDIRSKDNSDAKSTDVAIPNSGVIYVKGDVFISGVLDSRLTVGSTGTIYITGKDPTEFTPSNATVTGGLTYANENIPMNRDQVVANMSDDMLGLITSGNVVVTTRTWPSTGSSGKTTASANNVAISNIKIRSAILGTSSSSNYSVEYISDLSNLGYIYLLGSKSAQKTGATWDGNNQGYRENNTFDYRMLYDAPPHFLEPTNSGWDVKSWKEVANP